MRTAASLVLVAGLVATLAACSTPTANTVACDATPSGSVSDSVKVSGEFGAEPTVTFGSPLAVDSTQRTVITKGDGDTAVKGDTVNVDFALYSGTTGEQLTATGYTEGSTTAMPVDDAQLLTGIVKTLDCATVGSRVVGVIPPADGFGESGSAQLGVAAGDDIVFVVDIVSIDPPAEPVLPKADGADQPPVDGFPTVVLDADGVPTVTIPATDPPADFGLEVLKLGTGATVQDGDDVTVNYQGINWNTGTIFDDSWARGTPATFNTSEVIAGFTQALVGQTVGSQVVVIIPPDLGYGPQGGSAPNIGATDTIVFVIDILGIG